MHCWGFSGIFSVGSPQATCSIAVCTLCLPTKALQGISINCCCHRSPGKCAAAGLHELAIVYSCQASQVSQAQAMPVSRYLTGYPHMVYMESSFIISWSLRSQHLQPCSKSSVLHKMAIQQHELLLSWLVPLPKQAAQAGANLLCVPQISLTKP